MRIKKTYNHYRLNKSKKNHGFTLIEMLVIAPILILMIGAFIGSIISITGETLIARNANKTAYNIQDTLSRIKQDVELSDGYLATNNIEIVSPQGYDNDIQIFNNVDTTSSGLGSMLILNTRATDKNPLNPTRNFKYAQNQPNLCSGQFEKNLPLMLNVIYFVKNNSLWRRVIMPSNYETIGCNGAPWQRPSCDPSITNAFCKTKDTKLLDDVPTSNGFVINYYPTPLSSTPNTTAVDFGISDAQRQIALQANTTVEVTVKVEAQKINQTDKMRAVSPSTSTKSMTITTLPTNATVSSGANATFTAIASKTNASVMWQQSTDKGVTWTDTGITTTTLTRSAVTNVMDGYLYRAVFTGGTDVITSPSVHLTINLDSWTSLTFTNNGTRTWLDYDTIYNSAGYRKTTAGVVILRGSIKTTSAVPIAGDVIGQLPVSYRPSGMLAFVTGANSNVFAKIDIDTNGNIIYRSGGNGTMLSLEGIHFIPNNGRYTATPINIFSNGWSSYNDSGYSPASYIVDSLGRVHTQGHVSYGTNTNETKIYGLPSTLLPSEYMTLPSASTNFSGIGLSPSTSGMVAKGIGTSYITTNATYFPSGTGTWNDLSLLNSWVTYNYPTYTKAQYTKASDGLVSLRGHIKSGTIDATIATLPAGYRPIKKIFYTIISNNAYGRIDIDSSGNISCTTGNNTWVSLDGIIFYADQ